MLSCGYHSLHQVQESPYRESQSNWTAYLNSLPSLRDPSSILLVIWCLKYSYISSRFLVVRSKRTNPVLAILPQHEASYSLSFCCIYYSSILEFFLPLPVTLLLHSLPLFLCLLLFIDTLFYLSSNHRVSYLYGAIFF